jgi:hypothetical protein
MLREHTTQSIDEVASRRPRLRDRLRKFFSLSLSLFLSFSLSPTAHRMTSACRACTGGLPATAQEVLAEKCS